MPRSEAQIRADKKYHEKVHALRVDYLEDEYKKVDKIKKKYNLTYRQIVSAGLDKIERDDKVKTLMSKYDSCTSFREIRALSGMTQRAFANMFGIPLRTIQDWDGGVSAPSPYILNMIKYILSSEGVRKGE